MSTAALRRLQDWGAETAIVLGSGLSSLVENAGPAERLAYSEFAELPSPTVPGHSGEFVLEELSGKRIVFAKGRVHLYEGHTAQAVTAGIRVLAQAGVQRVMLTNAAGSANPVFPPGSWMMLRDHINFTGTSPLAASVAAVSDRRTPGPQFIDMTETYSRAWRSMFAKAASEAGITLHEGVYAGVLGPQYETPAEVGMLQHLGADAVGMSTVLEAIQARALGLEVAGFSCLTNWAAGMSGEPMTHDDVLATGEAAARDFERLLDAALHIG